MKSNTPRSLNTQIVQSKNTESVGFIQIYNAIFEFDCYVLNESTFEENIQIIASYPTPLKIKTKWNVFNLKCIMQFLEPWHVMKLNSITTISFTPSNVPLWVLKYEPKIIWDSKVPYWLRNTFRAHVGFAVLCTDYWAICLAISLTYTTG